MPDSIRCGGEAIHNTNPLGFQRIEHFTQGGVLAPDTTRVGHADFLKNRECIEMALTYCPSGSGHSVYSVGRHGDAQSHRGNRVDGCDPKRCLVMFVVKLLYQTGGTEQDVFKHLVAVTQDNVDS